MLMKRMASRNQANKCEECQQAQGTTTGLSGDLLCHNCADQQSKAAKHKQDDLVTPGNGQNGNQVPASQGKAKDSKSASVNDDSVNLMSDHSDSFIVNPLLSYILYSLQSGTEENVQRAVLGNFTAAQIIEAKDQLWDKCEKHIGKKLRRVGSSMRPEHEAHLQDIFT